MAPWFGTSSRINDQYRKYLEPRCFTNYDNFQKEVKRQITTLNNRDQKSFCTKCQKIKQEINEKNNELKNCYSYNILKNKLINDDDINAFMEKCLEQPKCSYSGASNARSPPALKGKQEKTCRGSNDCNRVATLVKESAGKNNTPNPNDLVVARPGVSDPKVIYPSGTTRHESIPKPAASASLNSLTSALGSSSNDSSSRITLGTDSSTTAIAQQQNLGTSSHESDQHSPQHVNSNPLSAQDIGSRTSQDQDTDERSHNGKDAAVITLGDGNPGTEVISNLLEGIADLGGLPRLHNKITDAAAGGEMYVNGVPLEIPVGKPLSDSTTGDNPEIKYKNYTAMALAPTGVIMLMTLLSKVNQIKRRNTRKDIRQNIERILLLESPAKTEESSYSFAYSPSQYWEK
ncbi:variable surface protein Vir18, putative [Plasmodium vivax]|uniref:Variable surface protein Vir18, putative n=1 Tax=Plasmodium vivax (strain Salvador I) TaxID=126793 RepID=A5JYZ5_PLAVS|nr:variable surface protein Vir18, putative [Plasmodium vivax]EDL47206.1 variable surface protein Vir18, putative [Plasmodium vivax]|eukprot:XP_001616933.1 variable surface protein Vir18 [Plasmodium vivax Sal-1]